MVIPRYTFTGNSLNMIEIMRGNEPIYDAIFTTGVNALLSTYIADSYIRQRISRNVNAFMLKEIPVPRDEAAIRRLGRMALPLFGGVERPR